MSVSTADVIAIAPEFASPFPTATIQTFINDAVLSVNPEAWGERIDLGVKYLTAHNLTISFPDGSTGGGSGSSGAIKSEKAGGLSVTYESAPASSGASSSDQMLSATKYGKRYATLKGETPGGPMVITPGLNQSGVLL